MQEQLKSMDDLFIILRQLKSRKLSNDEIAKKLELQGFTPDQVMEAFMRLDSIKTKGKKKDDSLSEIEKYQSGSGTSFTKKKKEEKNPILIDLEKRYNEQQNKILLMAKKGFDTTIINMKLLQSYTDLVYLRTMFDEDVAKRMTQKIKIIEGKTLNIIPIVKKK
jgi:hypothetical protein